MKAAAFFAELFLLRGRWSVTGAILLIAAPIYSALPIPPDTDLGFLILGGAAHLHFHGELGRNEGLLLYADHVLGICALILGYIGGVTVLCFAYNAATGTTATDGLLMGAARVLSFAYCYWVRRVAYAEAVVAPELSRMKLVLFCAAVTPCAARRLVRRCVESYKQCEALDTERTVRNMERILERMRAREDAQKNRQG